MVEILSGEKSSLKNVVIASWVILTVLMIVFVLGAAITLQKVGQEREIIYFLSDQITISV